MDETLDKFGEMIAGALPGSVTNHRVAHGELTISANADDIVKVATSRAPVEITVFGNVVGDVFIRKCERKGGALVNSIIKTYPNVSQFWTYDEKAFLANPVYARDYPPAKNLE